MRMVPKLAVSSGLLVVLATAGIAGGNVKDYLTDDGKLKATLEIKNLQGGFAGFTGKMWKVDPNGQWTEYQVFNQKLTPKGKGMLNKEQVEALAKDLAKYDVKSLKNMGRVGANPHVVTIQFGKQKAELQLQAGMPLPKPAADSVAGRYSGIVQSVMEKVKKASK